MNTVQTSLFAILFATFLSETFSLVCLSSFCPNGGVCNDYCTGSSDVCHLITHSLDLKDFKSIEMSCSHSIRNCSNECIPEPTSFGNLYYCCCTTDYCNHMPGETDHLIPVLEIPTNLPPEPRPSVSSKQCINDMHVAKAVMCLCTLTELIHVQVYTCIYRKGFWFTFLYKSIQSSSIYRTRLFNNMEFILANGNLLSIPPTNLLILILLILVMNDCMKIYKIHTDASFNQADLPKKFLANKLSCTVCDVCYYIGCMML